MRLGECPDRELEELLALGHESRSFEVKGPGNPGDLGDKPYVAKIAKAVIAMGNLRDGGLVCLGIDEPRMSAMKPGLSTEQVAAWVDYDLVHAAIARYADPPVSFEPAAVRLSSDVDVVVLQVDEFDNVPHLCRRDFDTELAAGELYIRPAGMPRSARVPDSREMREVLELAIDKGVRELLRRTRSIGLGVADLHLPETADRTAFEAEVAEAWKTDSTTLERLRNLGHTDIAIRALPYERERLGPAPREAMLAELAVRMRGWPLPYIDQREQIIRAGTFIGQDISPTVVPHLEGWRLFTSGQFLHRRALGTDMRDSPILEPNSDRATGAVALWDIVLYFVEVAELAARMSRALDAQQVEILVELKGVAGRELISGDEREHVRAGLIVHRSQLSYRRQFATAALLADARGIGITLAQGILRQFGLDLPDAALNDIQARVFGT